MQSFSTLSSSVKKEAVILHFPKYGKRWRRRHCFGKEVIHTLETKEAIFTPLYDTELSIEGKDREDCERNLWRRQG